MSVLNDKLEKIIADSGINFYKEEIGNELRAKYKLMELSEAIQKMWNSLPDNANIAIYGLGLDAQYLFDAVDLTKKNVVCMVDNNPKLTDFKGYPVIRRGDLLTYKIDVVIITSHLYAYEMITDVESVLPNCEIIYMWDNPRVMGCVFLEIWMRLFPRDFFYNAFLLNAVVASNDTTRDFRYLLYVINGYLEFKDFKNALDFIDKYISSGYPGIEKMRAFKDRLIDLLNEIKQKLAANQNPSVLVVLPDALSATDVTFEQAPFLYGLGQNNIHCPNAYSHVSWTTTSILTIFNQKSYIDNRLYKNATFTGTEPFFEYFAKNDIDFSYYWPYNGKALFNSTPDKIMNCPNGCADIIWQYLCASFENGKKSVRFLHFSETHDPVFFLTGFAGLNSKENIRSQCVKYIDSQMEFLFDLLPVNTGLIFSSDHGRGMFVAHSNSRIAYCKEKYSIPYIICDRKTHSGTDKRLVSHLDTLDIVLNLLNDKPAFENINHRTFVETNEEFLYTENRLSEFVNIFGKLKAFCAHKGFITETDKYVISYDGEEGYFLLSDDGTNLIGDPKYADRINWFRQNVNTEFPDFSDDNGRYEATRKYFDIDKKKV